MVLAIEVIDVSKKYKSANEIVYALDNVSLKVKEGEIFGLLGPNGAGKTTLISILAGILSNDTGSAKILGLDCVRDSKQLQQKINVVSGFTGAPFTLSCEEALMYYSLLYNVKNAKEKIQEVISATQLGDALKLPVQDFSSGMKQRYLIAKALLNDPKVLILDEPTVGLDVESAINIRDMVRKLRHDGRTILLTTHNMFEAEELCDRIAFINKGRIVDVGTLKELREKIVGKRIIEINCSDPKMVIKLLKGIPNLSLSSPSPKLVHVVVKSYAKMKEILSNLSDAKCEIRGITALEPTLEETYIHIINRSKIEGEKLE